METKHLVLNHNSKEVSNKTDKKVDLIVTSPPYPMIKMWDELFKIDGLAKNEEEIKNEFKKSINFLDEIWNESLRLLSEDAIVCINIGDATRKIGSQFRLFNNHQKIVEYFLNKGFVQLPSIIWRKQTNSPNKFMGSGMLPVGAYVTLEHEYILIFRKQKRDFSKNNEKENRLESAFFWEERNVWFNDVWDVKGIKQKSNILNSRERTAAYPFEIPDRLIKMFSVKGDTVLDPFLGTGTTTLAAMLNERNSIGVELDEGLYLNFVDSLNKDGNTITKKMNKKIDERILEHEEFVANSQSEVKYFNENLKTRVKTKQELGMKINKIKSIQIEREKNEAMLRVNYF